jgi:predicted PurR-regulated permease PerM
MWGLWRAPAVVLTVLLALAVIAALGSTIAVQIAQLAEELPKYESNLKAKVRALSGASIASGALDRASNTLRDLQEEITKQSPAGSSGQKPIPVEVRQPELRGLQAICRRRTRRPH